MTIAIIDHDEIIERELAPLRETIGADFDGYRNHVYRVLTYAMHFLGGDAKWRETVAFALAYHDVGLWTDKALAYLANQSLGDLLLAEADATAATLIKNGRPTRVMRISTLDERVMGALMMHYMLETMFAAHLLGVDAFDQPAVEEGKILTRQYLAARVSSTGRRS